MADVICCESLDLFDTLYPEPIFNSEKFSSCFVASLRSFGSLKQNLCRVAPLLRLHQLVKMCVRYAIFHLNLLL
jgi:hypothetical protein